MKKLAGIMSLLVILSIGVSACGSKAQPSGNQPSQTSPAIQNSGQGSGNQPDKGTGTREKQGQFAKADLVGEVVSVSGSDISLKIIGMPDSAPGDEQKNPDISKDALPQNNAPQSSPQPKKQTGDQPREREFKYTGETKTLYISSDIPITTFTRGQNGREETKVELKDVKQGDVLQIWYSDKEKGAISRISLMTSRGK